MIDFHVHQPSSGGSIALYGSNPYDAATLIAAMDHFGIEMSVVFTLDGLWRPGPAANDSLAAWLEGHGDRLVGFGTVDPQHPGAASETERCLSTLGFRGMKFHPWAQGVSPQHPAMDPIAEVAGRHGAPILFHDGTPPYCAPLQIAALARRHPDTPIILGHGGLEDMYREAAAAVCSTPNLFVCLCCTPDVGMRHVVAHCPPDRLLWGTDAGVTEDPRSPFVAERVAQARLVDIPEALRRRMLSENPRRLLGLAG